MAGRLKTLFAEEIVMLSKVWGSRPRRQHRLAQQSKYCSNLFCGNIYRHKLAGVNNLRANGFNKEDRFFARSITTLCLGIMAGSSATGSCDKEQIKIDYKCNWIFHVMPDLQLSHVFNTSIHSSFPGFQFYLWEQPLYFSTKLQQLL